MRCCKGLVVGAALILGACTNTYHISGMFEGSTQVFQGTVSVGLGQSGSLDVSSVDGAVQCTGTSEVTQLPSGYSTIGAQGIAEATCTDGRSFKVDFVQTRSSGGHGQGIDNAGRIVQLYFDMSEGTVQSMLERHQLNTLVQ
ncbi:hypothetical protein ACFL12_03995 [Pseudomonadota bacterium]